jgi:glutamyl-tRNA synthetase
MTIRTRFAPSPTGFLHIGGARTALFCHLHARHHGGEWVLRIEDTDRERSTQAAIDAILDGLHWLGLDHDGEIVYQSRCLSQHLATIQQLLDRGEAYRCYCSREELEAMREIQRDGQLKPRYDGRCRERSADEPVADRPYVVRLKTPRTGDVVWQDTIQGEIRISNGELDDLVLLRSDGSPTYNLAVVVDDHAMGITHVIRGEDHISNTPRQIHIFRALGWPVPEYAHMPLLHGTDGAKLSKRHGAVSVLSYRDDGFLPEAINNYLVRLGWSHGDQEIFSMDEMIQLFDVSRVGRSAAVFNQSKLLWLNGHYMRQATPERLLPELVYQLERQGIPPQDPDWLLAILPGLRDRAKTVAEIVTIGRFYFVDSVEPYDARAAQKHLKPEILVPLTDLANRLTLLPAWDTASIESVFQQVLAAHAPPGTMSMGKLAQPVRVAVTGSDVSPSLFDVLALLGRERSIVRLQRCLAWLAERDAAGTTGGAP